MTENMVVEKTAYNETEHVRTRKKGVMNKWVDKNLLLILTLLGVLVGALAGFSLRLLNLSETSILLISYPGEIYMRILKLVILPLIMSSLITGCSSVNAKLNGKIALRTFSCFIVTTMFNALLGVILAITIHPGNPGMGISVNTGQQERKASSVLDNILDMGRNIAADNIFQATFQQTYTDYVNVTTKNLDKLNGTSITVSKMEKVLKYRLGINNLGIVFFCIAFGTILGTMGSKGAVIKDFFAVVFEIIMKMVKGILWITPVGLCSIITGKIISVTNITVVMSQLGWLILTVILGVFLYQFIVLQLLYFLIVKKNPFTYYIGVLQGTLTAFAAASTSAALPVNMDLMDNELNIDPRITRFVMPIGCNTNLDGTAMFLAISTIFIAQMSGMSLGSGPLLTIWLTSTIMSFAVTSVPSSSLVILFMILSSLGIPSSNVPLLFAVDWLVLRLGNPLEMHGSRKKGIMAQQRITLTLVKCAIKVKSKARFVRWYRNYLIAVSTYDMSRDRFRTTNNMLGDCYTAAIVEKLSKQELLASDNENTEGEINCKNLKTLNEKFDNDMV